MQTMPAPGGLRRRVTAGVGGVVREVASRAVTPLVPADYLDGFAPLRRGADLRARIEEIRPETADAATVLLRPGADWAGHVPGQYVRIGIDVDGVRRWRAYSLTHGPRPDGRISITVKAVPDGIVSRHLVHAARPGTLVHLDQAAGEFVLPDDGGAFLFLTAGSGITPVIGMLRNLFPSTDSGVVRTARGSELDIVVVHVAPTEADSMFARDLRSLADAGAIRLVAHHTGRDGAFHVDDLSSLVPDLNGRVTFACGPPALLDDLERHHDERGLPLTTERFRMASLVTGNGGAVRFSVQQQTVTATGDRPLLDEAEDAGVLMPSGCRMGICYGCVLPLREGTVRDLRTGETTHAVAGEGVRIQTCVNAAAGDCLVDH